jgi:hypothetical protein
MPGEARVPAVGAVIAVALVDDHPIMRLGLAHLVRATGDLDLVAEVACVEDLDRSGRVDNIRDKWQERRLAVLVLRWSEQRRRREGPSRSGANGGA